MEPCALWVLLSLLVLTHAEQDIPMADGFDMYQREIDITFPLQQESDGPRLTDGLLIPRGRRPVKIAKDLNGFPPGKPNRANIGNICRKSRSKVSYGPDNLPQTGYGYLSRQGDALNMVENGYSSCCSQSDKLGCAVTVWTNAMDEFCEEEFTVKTRHYHCCKSQGLARETCFVSEAPNPDYATAAFALQEMGSAEDISSLARSLNFKPSSLERSDSKYKLSELAFPPGEPKSSNIQNICKLRKFRPLYSDDMLPTTSFAHYGRRAKAINRAEKEYKKCCKNEDVACAHSGWKKALSDFCSKELRVKTRHHECCQKKDADMFSCFAREAPFPEYDREVESLNLGDITKDVMEKICRECKLLTKQKQIPLLVSGLKDSCCSLPEDKKLTCAQEQKENFLQDVCGPKKDLWKDSQNCCSKDGPEREKCFSAYLQISLAVSQRRVGE